MATVWIIDDKEKERDRAKVVLLELSREGYEHTIIEWDGVSTLPSSKKADIIVLDINLENDISGFDLITLAPECSNPKEGVTSIPGIGSNEHNFGPFIVFWTHFGGDYQHSHLQKYTNHDRIVRARSKSQNQLKEILRGFFNRYQEEGVWHGE